MESFRISQIFGRDGEHLGELNPPLIVPVIKNSFAIPFDLCESDYFPKLVGRAEIYSDVLKCRIVLAEGTPAPIEPTAAEIEFLTLFRVGKIEDGSWAFSADRRELVCLLNGFTPARQFQSIVVNVEGRIIVVDWRLSRGTWEFKSWVRLAQFSTAAVYDYDESFPVGFRRIFVRQLELAD